MSYIKLSIVSLYPLWSKKTKLTVCSFSMKKAGILRSGFLKFLLNGFSKHPALLRYPTSSWRVRVIYQVSASKSKPDMSVSTLSMIEKQGSESTRRERIERSRINKKVSKQKQQTGSQTTNMEELSYSVDKWYTATTTQQTNWWTSFEKKNWRAVLHTRER